MIGSYARAIGPKIENILELTSEILDEHLDGMDPISVPQTGHFLLMPLIFLMGTLYFQINTFNTTLKI
ncbi:hypothetical protein L596_003731 [Steinernema carpocapsae]|uniref:Uncharacterized protein n=1 Tax=Steinernema carpocapsae TaxID=34508 RepID=A0A4U8UTH3_STECR|nr:hypothetical protein L596_003731 [Steinernema carpocapsae]